MKDLFVGIDLGTSGVRAMAVGADGRIAATASVPLAPEVVAPQPGRHEQPPLAWWRAVGQACSGLVAELDRAGVSRDRLAAVCVDGTSGTVVALDRAGEPVRPAMMYNDPRAAAEGDELNELAGPFCEKLGYRFNASFALAKILWVARNEPENFSRTSRFVHQADYILGRLCGVAEVSDYSNALKTGFDLVDESWPQWIDQLPGVRQRLPRVVAPGTRVGTLSAAAADHTGLPAGLGVVAGATDGTAALLASGACQPGDYNTTLGTTLVLKGISRRICRHPQGLIYCHKLPGGLWLPGAASNTGCQWIADMFSGCDPVAMDAAAAPRLPHPCVAWPLMGTGERFPLLSKAAQGFFVPEPADPVDRYAACLQGTALVERLCYQVLDEAATAQVGGPGGEVCRGARPVPGASSSGRPGSGVYGTGGGSRSDVWMQCRADVTGRPMHRPGCGESAFGSAVLACMGTYDSSVDEAIRRMVRIQRTFEPDRQRAGAFDDLFQRFCEELRQRGYCY